MATTTNFGWETPDDTDLVKDGALAMRTLGNAIDTSLVDLKGGTTGQILSKTSNTDMDFTWITNDVGDITAVTAGTGISGGGTSGAVTITNDMATTITASGDIIVGTGSGTYDNLPIGTTGQVLTADTTVSPYKVKWASVSAGGMTSIASGSLPTNTNTITLNSISGTYIDLRLFVSDFYMASDDYLQIRLNGATGNDYGFVAINHSAENTASLFADGVRDRIFATLDNTSDNSQKRNFVDVQLRDYADTSHYKVLTINSLTRDGANTFDALGYCVATLKSTSAISSITLFSQNGSNFSGGTYTLYGVK